LQDLLNYQNEQIIVAFFKALISPPYGTRKTVIFETLKWN